MSPNNNTISPLCLSLPLSDGYRTPIFCYQPPPQIERRMPVVYVHGIQSHPGWFVESAKALAGGGFPVYHVTRRGSGENKIASGHAESAEILLEDLDCACEFVIRQEEELGFGTPQKLNLLGVSWGGKLLSCYCLGAKRAQKAASLTLVAPGIVPKVNVGLRIKLTIPACLVFDPMRKFPLPLDNTELFTDNPQKRQFLDDDPLRLRSATAKFMFASGMLDIMLKKAGAGSLTMPVTLLLAGRDRIIDNEATGKLIKRLAGENLTVHRLEAAHTIEFEEDPSDYYEILLQSMHENRS